MNRQRFEQEEFTPSMYPAPTEKVRPILPVRADVPENEEPFLPELPMRQDVPARGSEKATDVDAHRVIIRTSFSSRLVRHKSSTTTTKLSSVRRLTVAVGDFL